MLLIKTLGGFFGFGLFFLFHIGVDDLWLVDFKYPGKTLNVEFQLLLLVNYKLVQQAIKLCRQLFRNRPLIPMKDLKGIFLTVK